MLLLNIRMCLHDLARETGRKLFKPGWMWLANYRITLLESELYRLDKKGPFSDSQFSRVVAAVSASEAHLEELNERIAHLDRCRSDGVKPGNGLDYADIARFARLSREQLVNAIRIPRQAPTGGTVVRA